MKQTSILLILISILLLSNIVFSSEITNSTPHRHAELFLRYFHTISFKKAVDVFNILDQNNQNHVLQKVMEKKDQTIFWMLYLLPQEIQFRLYTDYNAKYIKNLDIQAIMNSRSIQEHSQWFEKINNLLNNTEFFTIHKARQAFSYDYLKNKGLKQQDIILNKVELFTLGNEKLTLLKSLPRKEQLSKKELMFLTDMLPSILEKLRHNCIVFSDGGYHPYGDLRIKYEYKKPMNLKNIIEYGVKSCKEVLPAIIASLLVCYGAKWSFPDLFKEIQDPILITENKRKELANIFITQVQNAHIPGSEFLRLENINEIPFTLVNGKLDCGLILSQVLIPLIIYNRQPKNIIPYYCPLKKKKKTHFFLLGRFAHKCYQNKTLDFNKHLISLFSLAGWTIPLIPYSHIVYPVIFFSSIVIAIINGILTLKNKTKEKVIDFPRQDFEKLSVKEILTRYLNKKTKIILEKDIPS